ncbi:MAG TPA: amidohydrolase family protein [Acidimicrobiales bacterium]|nr:amidohydrolase family protein [Acidimicrobiales bacterium]
MVEIPRIVSVDDHVIEPAHLFERWLPSRYRKRGPQNQRKGIAKTTLHGGSDYRFEFSDDAPMADMWVYEDLISPLRKNIASAGFPREEMSLTSLTYDEIRPGCFDPVERLKDMDINWVEASLCFPTFPRFCGQTFNEAKDKEVALACVRAYNDWMVEEWCGDSGGRLIPLIIIPLWDVQLAVQEIERNAARGVRAVTFSELPAKLGLPSIHTGYWDPFFAACADLGVVVNMHIGSSSAMATASPDAPPAVQITLSFNYALVSMCDYLFSGLFVRFPKLKVAYSEGQMGWIPFVLQRADDVWHEHRGWAGVADALPEPPSTYFFSSVYACFFRDAFGIEVIERIGPDNITFETDYPHTDTTWPDTKKIATEMLLGVPDEIVYKLLRGNAITMLGLDLD